ncbi:MAG: dockerin type I repeat-containing protein, partial [Clostridia bacterium]|nr:dockerin type I repeat-containing protein [Clostridia bacterium]
ALGHNYKADVTDPDCETGGYTVHTCYRCEDSYTDSYTQPLGHISDKNATCTDNSTCTVCGKILVDSLGHKYDSAIIDPTCETGGYTTHTCSRCGDSYTDSITEALGHREGSEATCTTAQICVDCGKVLVDALGHEYDAVVTSPTCETGGYTTHTCSRCGDSYTDSITEALGHEAGEWVIVTEAGLETEGLKEKRCKNCSELLESEIIEPIGYRVGDVNMNGRIDTTDYALVKRHCLKTFTLNEKQQLLADVNGNGRVDATDYALIKRHCLKTFDIYA